MVTTQTGVTIPEGENIKYYEYKTGYTTQTSKIYNKCEIVLSKQANTDFYNEISTSSLWNDKCPTAFIGISPSIYGFGYVDGYYMIFNTHTKEYNALPSTEGRHAFIAMHYDYNSGSLYIYDYTINYVQ
jgi:hypothetical protein